MDSIRNIIAELNNSLDGIFKGSKFYGVATIVEREGRSQPVVDSQPVAFDDSYGLQMYHRLGNVVISYQPGYGDNDKTTNTYSVSAVVFNNEQTTKLKTDELATIIQSLLAASSVITPVSIILDSRVIFATEYRGVTYSLNEYQSLMQINYTVDLIFKSNCFDICPADFSNCKN